MKKENYSPSQVPVRKWIVGSQLQWKDRAVIILAFALAWGLRGQHGHERGAALAGAMAGLSLAAVTGGARWIGAAVIGSLTFAIGGSLSYGRFVSLAYAGSLEAISSLALIGFAWGGVGALGLGLGLALPKYRLWERITIAGGLFLVWFLMDRLIWGRLTGPEDLATRQLMAAVLMGAWILLSAYVGVWRQDRTSLRLAFMGGIGCGIGFAVASWVQGVGQLTGLHLDWWKVSEHLIGLFAGIGLVAGLSQLEPHWTLPLSVRPWERWCAAAWLLWLLPLWLLANNLDFWIVERAVVPVWVGKLLWALCFLLLGLFAFWGWLEMKKGRTFATSWSPRQLRTLFLSYLWLTTGIAVSKTLVYGRWTSTPTLFILFAFVITLLILSKKTHPQ